MNEDDDYELLPRQEVEKLKKELERFKKNPIGDIPEGTSLVQSIDNLNNNIKKLIEIFSNSEAELSKYYAENNPLEDLKAIKEQNEQIAQGIVTVADMIKDTRGASQDSPKMPEQIFPQQQPQTQALLYSPPQQQQGYSQNNQQNYNYPNSPQIPDFPDNPPSQLTPPPFFDPTIPPTPDKKKGLFSRR